VAQTTAVAVAVRVGRPLQTLAESVFLRLFLARHCFMLAVAAAVFLLQYLALITGGQGLVEVAVLPLLLGPTQRRTVVAVAAVAATMPLVETVVRVLWFSLYQPAQALALPAV
jgi:hypothetical protein